MVDNHIPINKLSYRNPLAKEYHLAKDENGFLVSRKNS